MAHSETDDSVPALPLPDRLGAPRMSPLATGAWIFGAMLLLRGVAIAVALPLHALLDAGAPPSELRDVRIGFVMALLFGYATASYGWSVRSLQREVDALHALLGGPATPFARTRAHAGRLSRATRRRTAAFGIGLALLVPFLVDRDPGLYLQRDYWHAENLLNWILLPFLGALLACVLRSLWEDARRLTRLAEDVPKLDLLDTRPLAPFGRHALRIALLTVAIPSVSVLLLADRGFAALVLACAVGGAAMATTAFLLPVQGIHRRLVADKEAELGRVRAALRGDTAAIAKSGLSAYRDHVSVADLLAYEARIASVREWPFDVPTLVRFAALVLLPVGSWLGGAVVERLLSRIVGG